ncbi:MAG: hypothetical protein FWB86_01820, partial [Treponema sp.]|nr:hypothetical protein [Treponema sp.]
MKNTINLIEAIRRIALIVLITMAVIPAFAEDSSTTPNYGDGTPGLEYTLIDGGKAYCVDKGTVTSGVVTIPAFYRPNASSEYLPVTEVAGGIA